MNIRNDEMRYTAAKRKFAEKNRGYIIAEAAILMPVFLFSIVFLVYILQILHFQEIIHFEASEKLIRIAAPSISEQAASAVEEIVSGELTDEQLQLGESLVKRLIYQSRVRNAVGEKIDKDIDISARISMDNEVYIAEVIYPVEVSLLHGMDSDVTIREVLAARKWSGKNNEGTALPFDIMERSDDNNYVFVFPRYGERYHEGDCRYLFMDEGRYIECVSVEEALSGGYSQCLVCH